MSQSLNTIKENIELVISKKKHSFLYRVTTNRDAFFDAWNLLSDHLASSLKQIRNLSETFSSFNHVWTRLKRLPNMLIYTNDILKA